MERGKIIERTAIGFLCLFALTSVSLNIYLHQRYKKLSLEKASLPAITNEPATAVPVTTVQETTNAVSPSVGRENDSDDNIDDLEKQLAEIELELDKTLEKRSDKLDKEAEKKAKEKELQKISMQHFFDSQFGDLFNKLNLTDEKLDRFKDILVDENMARQELWSEIRTDGTTSLTEEEEAELRQRSEAINEEYEAKKADLLADDYEQYQDYIETQGERYYINNFITSLGSDENLTETQKEALIEAMHEEAKNVKIAPIDSETSASLKQKEIIARQVEYQSRRDEAYLNAARGILSVSQYEQFEEYFNKEHERFKLMMEMSALETEAQITE